MEDTATIENKYWLDNNYAVDRDTEEVLMDNGLRDDARVSLRTATGYDRRDTSGAQLRLYYLEGCGDPQMLYEYELDDPHGLADWPWQLCTTAAEMIAALQEMPDSEDRDWAIEQIERAARDRAEREVEEAAAEKGYLFAIDYPQGFANQFAIYRFDPHNAADVEAVAKLKASHDQGWNPQGCTDVVRFPKAKAKIATWSEALRRGEQVYSSLMIEDLESVRADLYERQG